VEKQIIVVLALASALLVSRDVAQAQDHQHASAERLGSVHFATSCSVAAQAQFDRAVALLHSFQFKNAIDAFNAALVSDPACGIANWGIALSQWSNPFAAGMKDKTQLQAGRASVDRGHVAEVKTERERAYISAVAKLYSNFGDTQRVRTNAYRDAMAEVAAKYSQDTEAQIFYALALAASADPADKTYADRLKAGAILEKLFAEEPNHPGLAHYIIHTYDVPPLADRALNAARRYSAIAPDAPHALHMPSHTFTRTGDWRDSINSNVAAAAAARREHQTAEELHASDYEIYAYLQAAQDDSAKRVLDSLPEIAALFDPEAIIGGAGGPSAGYFALAAIPARYAIERQDWRQAAQLTPHETPFPYTEAMTWFARGIGSARLGQANAAREAVTALHQIRDRLSKADESYWAKQVQIQQLEVEAFAALAEKKKDEALQQMKSAADLEDGTDKSAITPGPLAPARELLGQLLLELNEPAAALEQFESTLKKEPNRFRALYGAGHAARLNGNATVSQRYFLQLLKICGSADNSLRPEILEAKKATW
jgi:hypothetical protein